MSGSAQLITTLLAYATALGQLGIVIMILVLVAWKTAWARKIIALITRFARWLGLGIALSGVALSLYYSNIVGFEPCLLCWWQRIFLYPQLILFAGALWLKDRLHVYWYSLALSVLGLATALYHVQVQFTGHGAGCGSQGVSCAKRLVFELGYISMPVMSATAFGLVIVVILAALTQRKIEKQTQ